VICALLMGVISCGSSKENVGVGQSEIPAKSHLTQLGKSGRISSNHYSDVVLDSKGNAYIANFFTNEDNQDYIKIIQVKPTGEIGWSIGESTVGRATAITINEEDEIWVTGYFSSTFNCGGKVLQVTAEENMFIVRLDQKEVCDWTFKSENNSKAFDINVNNEGSLVIASVLSDSDIFGEVTVSKELENSQFLARFSRAGNCTWVKQFNGNVRRTKSGADGQFYVCGGFSNQLFGSDSTYRTRSNYDYDGFLIQVTDSIN
jgi:hypothetical protein